MHIFDASKREAVMFKRVQVNALCGRLKEPRKFIQVLAGPRQVGKTTIALEVLKQLNLPSHYAAADAVRDEQDSWLRQQWEVARVRMAASGQPFVLVVDEVQKVSNWSETVKALWDEDSRLNRDLRVVLLGSSRLLLQQGLSESLAGRYELIPVGHWTYGEMREAFSMDAEQYVWFGGYPGAVDLIYEEERWQSYINDSLVDAVISRDILMLTRVHKPALLRQLFELGCAYTGQLLAFNKMLGQLHDAGNTTTLAHYLALLSQAGLLAGLEKYAKGKVMKKSSSPKLQVFNTALSNALRPEKFEQARQQPALWGRVVESAIGAHLLNAATTGEFELYYWREGNEEVDFVLERHGNVIALEVKTGPLRRRSGMAAFEKRFSPHRILLVGDEGLPWEEFLGMPPAALFR